MPINTTVASPSLALTLPWFERYPSPLCCNNYLNRTNGESLTKIDGSLFLRRVRPLSAAQVCMESHPMLLPPFMVLSAPACCRRIGSSKMCKTHLRLWIFGQQSTRTHLKDHLERMCLFLSMHIPLCIQPCCLVLHLL